MPRRAALALVLALVAAMPFAAHAECYDLETCRPRLGTLTPVTQFAWAAWKVQFGKAGQTGVVNPLFKASSAPGDTGFISYGDRQGWSGGAQTGTYGLRFRAQAGSVDGTGRYGEYERPAWSAGEFYEYGLPVVETIIAIVAANEPVQDGTLELRGEGDVTLLGETRGTSTFLVTPEDFTTTEPVGVEAAHGGSPAVAARSNAVAHHSISHSFFGYFEASTDGTHTLDGAYAGPVQLSWDGPGGSGSGSTRYRFTSAPGGDYTFRIDKEIGLEIWPNVYAIGADIDALP
ncbi:MAG: hypothetical protein ABR548_09035 [Actinomycetota bacterium]|nr:hypothetical protein [Actinomycetota bacterium]